MDPQAALDAIDRAGQRVRRQRWWYVCAALVMAGFTAAFYIGMAAFPATVDALVLPGVLLVAAVTGLIGLRQRMVDRVAGRWENALMWASVGLALPTLALIRFVVPDGFTIWAVLVGVLPAVPFAVLAWRVARG
jgi:hypothetical protein